MTHVINSRIIYFAYGSNMFSPRLRERVPSAVAIGTGFVNERRLTFDKVSCDGSGKCDIQASKNQKDQVYGVLFEIAAEEKRNLDEAEGLGKGYGEEQVKVVIMAGGIYEAITYVAYPSAKDPKQKPYHWYKALVIAGAVEHSLPYAYIEWMRTFHSKPDLDDKRCAENESLIFQHRVSSSGRVGPAPPL